VICYDLAGKELWKFEMPTAAQRRFRNRVVAHRHRGTVIVVRDELKGSKILALDAATGKPRWEKGRLSPASYSTPVVWDTPAGKQIIVAGHARMIAYDLKTGVEKWSVGGLPNKPLHLAGGGGGSLSSPATRPAARRTNSRCRLRRTLKQFDKDKDGALSRAENVEVPVRGPFRRLGREQGRQGHRDEWDILMKFMTEGRARVRAEGRRRGRRDENARALGKGEGLAAHRVGLVYRGQLPHGEGRRPAHRVRRQNGPADFLQERALHMGSTGRRRSPRTVHLFRVA